MELMLTMEESDGSKSKSRTVHTQTDFGPYSAFPPPSEQKPLPAAPAAPVDREQQVVTEEGQKKTSDDTNHQGA